MATSGGDNGDTMSLLSIQNDPEKREREFKATQKKLIEVIDRRLSLHHDKLKHDNSITINLDVDTPGSPEDLMITTFHLTSPFKYPQKPIEQLTLLEKETEMERKERREREEAAKLQMQGKSFQQHREPVILQEETHIEYQRVFCKDDRSAGVRWNIT
eukprot:gene11003-12166_t